jgi:uncharacterized membrane protein
MAGTPLRTVFAAVLGATGLALCAWLAALKALSLPCLGGCEGVIHSSYGSVLGFPVGVYGAALWLGVFLAARPSFRLVCLTALGLGAAAFVALQAFALKAFCPFCLAHALVAWASWPLWRTRPARGGLAAAAIVAAAAVLVSATLPGRLALRHRSGFAALAEEQNGAAYWLGPRGPSSPVLVLSLTCPACLDRLAELEALDLAGRRPGPAIYLKVEKGEEDLAAAFVAAVQSGTGDRSEAFLAVAAYCLSQRDLLLSDPSGGQGPARRLSENVGQARGSRGLARGPGARPLDRKGRIDAAFDRTRRGRPDPLQGPRPLPGRALTAPSA